MKKYILFLFLLCCSFTVASFSSSAFAMQEADTLSAPAHQAQEDAAIELAEGEEAHSVTEAPAWTVIPFVALLLMIATGPLFYEHFWHKRYPLIAVGLALLVVLYYIFYLLNIASVIHALAEYIQFISLLAALYIASGGIMINIDKKATPLANVVLLLSGALISNFIGTTGASMLLIRPFIRLNKTRIKPYHVIFFIFIISNIGGSLTPIGDPPLFLGFLKGVPFFWTLTHNFLPWLFAILMLVGIFYILDRRNKESLDDLVGDVTYTNRIRLVGYRNFAWLGLIILAVFIDPKIFPEYVPGIEYHGETFSFVREIMLLTIAYLSYRFANKEAHAGNDFNFEPIREVAFIFIGIFGTMMPALELVGSFAKSPEGAELITHNTLFWGTGLLSGFLDNAPTYLNFLAAAMASKGASLSNPTEVTAFAEGAYPDSVMSLLAISIASVFFGAMTYIGNGPNFMVKSIAEQIGIKMPSFFGYLIRFSIPILLPLLVLVWVIFFAFQ